MVNIQEHIKRTNKTYKDAIEVREIEIGLDKDSLYGGKEIHAWMDDPVKTLGSNHRSERHNYNRDLPEVIKIFGKRFGEYLTKCIFIDHLSADNISERGQNKPRVGGVTTINIPVSLWSRINVLRLTPKDTQQQIISDAITLLENKRRDKYS